MCDRAAGQLKRAMSEHAAAPITGGAALNAAAAHGQGAGRINVNAAARPVTSDCLAAGDGAAVQNNCARSIDAAAVASGTVFDRAAVHGHRAAAANINTAAAAVAGRVRKVLDAAVLLHLQGAAALHGDTGGAPSLALAVKADVGQRKLCPGDLQGAID